MLVDNKRNGDLGPSLLVLSKNNTPYGYVVGYVRRNGEFYDIRQCVLIKTSEFGWYGGTLTSEILDDKVFDQSVEVHVRNVAFVSLLTGDLKKLYLDKVKVDD